MKSQLQVQWAALLKDIREEVIGLLFNRYVFRTVQEIIRHEPALHKYSPTFSGWTQVVYNQANSAGVRRLAGENPRENDASLVRLFDLMMKDAGELRDSFARYFRNDLDASELAVTRVSTNEKDSQVLACKRLIGEDRRRLLKAAEKAVHFASKRVAHGNPTAKVDNTYIDLDEAIDTVKDLTEKYILLVYDRKDDLHQQMKQRKLREGWDKLFLMKWTTPEFLALQPGEMPTPREPDRK